MEDTLANIADIKEHITEYVNNRISIIKLNTVEKSSDMLSVILALVFIFLVAFFFILFGSLALAYALAEWAGEFYVGFLTVAVVYLIIGFLIWLLKDRFFRLPIMRSLLNQLFNDGDYEKD